jgi:small-conductance mechanosensitive channel
MTINRSAAIVNGFRGQIQALLFVIELCCLCFRGYGQAEKQKTPEGGELPAIEYSRDTGMKRLDLAHVILNRINLFMGDEFNTRKIEQRLPEIGNTLQIIGNSLQLSDVIPEFKNLQLDGVMLGDITGELSAWRTSLFKYDLELADINKELESFSHDSSILRLASDTLYRELYLEELRELGDKWLAARRSTDTNLTRVKSLQLLVSKQYFVAVDLRSRTVDLQRRLAGQLFRNESGYLWDRTAREEVPDHMRALALRAFRSEAPLIGYFIGRNGISYIAILVIGAMVFWWMRRDARPGAGKPGHAALVALVIGLNIHPLFELHASTLPVSQVPLVFVLSVMFWANWARRQWFYWGIIVLLYVFLLVTRTVLIQLNGGVSLLVLNFLSGTIGYYSVSRIEGSFLLKGLVQAARWLYLGLNVLAMAANVCGRLSLARILTTSSLFGLVQAIGLSVFVSCCLECLRLQEAPGEKQAGEQRWARIAGQLEKGTFRLFRLLAVLTWLLSLAINLNVYDYLRSGYRYLLYHPVTIGSFSFQLANLLLFFLILYLSNLLQRVIGWWYSADDRTIPENARNGSRMVMLRLFLLIGGFLLAVGASGVPLDKVTIVLGALGVGIGLGLQNIVANFVSGFILVFERPFQIGDLIELNRKRGIVRDIGIRSSKIVREDGAEVVIPNGDLLSGQVINWTVRARRVRTAVSLTVEGAHTREEIERVVRDALAHQPGLAEEHQPQVLINSATDKSTNITVLAWVSNIGRIQAVNSEILSVLYQQFKEKGLRVV